MIITIPDLKETTTLSESKPESPHQLTMCEMFSSVSLFLPLFDLFSAMCGSGMLESMLESHLQHNAGASVIDVGVSFLSFGCSYMLGNITFGWVNEILIKEFVFHA